MTVSQEIIGVFGRNNLSLPKLILKNPEITFVAIGGKNFQTRDHAQIFTAKIIKFAILEYLKYPCTGNCWATCHLCYLFHL